LIAKYEPSSNWQALDETYLERGNWLTGELSKRVISDTKLQTRILIAHSIVTIMNEFADIDDKLFDLLGAMDVFTAKVTKLVNEGANLFDPDNPWYDIALTCTKGEVLLPKQVIVFGRYVDQRLAIQVDLGKINNEMLECKDPMGFYNYAKAIAKIAHRSCYDQGNINYNVDRVYGTQFKIVNTLARMTEDYTVLTGLKPAQYRAILTCTQYDEIAQEWEGYLPVLQVGDDPNSLYFEVEPRRIMI
jgi:hypothetical protein